MTLCYLVEPHLLFLLPLHVQTCMYADQLSRQLSFQLSRTAQLLASAVSSIFLSSQIVLLAFIIPVEDLDQNTQMQNEQKKCGCSWLEFDAFYSSQPCCEHFWIPGVTFPPKLSTVCLTVAIFTIGNRTASFDPLFSQV